MQKPQRRVIDPTAPARNLSDRMQGGVLEHDMQQRQQTTDRFDTRLKLPPIVFALGPWFLENPAANTTGQGMRLLMPSAATTYATTGTGIAIKQHRSGRVIGAQVNASSDVTTGSITVGVKISGGLTQPLSDCVLNTTNPRSYMVPVPWNYGISFASLDTVTAVLTTDAAYLPVTLDFQVLLFLAYEAV